MLPEEQDETDLSDWRMAVSPDTDHGNGSGDPTDPR